MSRPPADPVAAWLALVVRRCLITSPAERPDPPELPAGVIAVEAHATGELAVGVVVTVADQGNRYYIVRVHPVRRDV